MPRIPSLVVTLALAAGALFAPAGASAMINDNTDNCQPVSGGLSPDWGIDWATGEPCFLGGGGAGGDGDLGIGSGGGAADPPDEIIGEPIPISGTPPLTECWDPEKTERCLPRTPGGGNGYLESGELGGNPFGPEKFGTKRPSKQMPKPTRKQCLKILDGISVARFDELLDYREKLRKPRFDNTDLGGNPFKDPAKDKQLPTAVKAFNAGCRPADLKPADPK